MQDIIHGVMWMFSKILLAADGSDLSDNAARIAFEMGKLMGAQVTVISVLYSALKFEQTNKEDLEDQKKMANDTFKKMEKIAKEMGVALKTKLEEGPVWSKIVESAEEEGCALIVMGSRGKGALGSVAEKVVRDSSCPVLVIK